jgi:23S rRNA-/tRNA-specific pseudouridylate synthase
VKRSPVVVVAGREGTLGEVLARLGGDAEAALREGRVFIGRRRASSATERVASGDEVAMYAAREAGGESVRILVERGGIVGAYKPAHVATVADHRGTRGTLEDEVANLLGAPKSQLVATSRLDVGVSGVVLFATDSKARAALARARDEGKYRRHYVAIAHGGPRTERGVWAAPIGKAKDPRKRRVLARGGESASTAYAVGGAAGAAHLLAVEPITGRTHQIRVHAAHAGCPLYGDAAYGGPVRVTSTHGSVTAIARIALHAAWVEVPSQFGELRVEAEIPEDLAAIWTACGGATTQWALALQRLEGEIPSYDGPVLQKGR